MTVLTTYSSDDGYVTGTDTTYLTARSTATSAVAAGGTIDVGQSLTGGTTYNCVEGFLEFSGFSVLTAPLLIVAGSLFLRVQADNSATDILLKAQVKDWGASVTTADWIAGASLSATTYFGADSADAVAGSYLECPYEFGATPAYHAADFPLQFLLYSSRHKAGTAPTGLEALSFYATATAGTTSDPYAVMEYVSIEETAGYLNGAVGPACLYPRALTAAEVTEIMAQGMTVIERALDSGTVVIQGNVRTRSGAVVPAEHVRAGWWIHNIEASDDPLLITGHSVDLDAGKNALTIGVDWMEEETGAKLADVLAIPATTETTPAQAAASDPYMPDTSDGIADAGTEPDIAVVDETYDEGAADVPMPSEPEPTVSIRDAEEVLRWDIW